MAARTVLIAYSLICAIGSATAQADDQPLNTIDCSAFTKTADGNWYVGAPTTFDLGNVKRMTLGNSVINPHAMRLGGFSLFDVLERKCGASHK